MDLGERLAGLFGGGSVVFAGLVVVALLVLAAMKSDRDSRP
jgi:hypothetical protein